MMACRVCLKPVGGKPKTEGFHDACLRRLLGTAVLPPLEQITRQSLLKQGRERMRSGKRFSISGVQIKFTAKVNKGELLLGEQGGDLILKPDAKPDEFPGLPANEHVSMLIAKHMGLEVPACGLLPLADGSLLYVIRRFDRNKDGTAVHQEDLMQALSIANTTDAKYEACSYERAGNAVRTACGRGQAAVEFMKRLVAMFAIGNGDYHLKNISLIRPMDKPVSLTPLYDVVNTQVYDDVHRLAMDVMEEDELEAFSIHGFDTRADFLQLARALGVSEKAVSNFIDRKVLNQLPDIQQLISNSYLDRSLKPLYLEIIEQHFRCLAM